MNNSLRQSLEVKKNEYQAMKLRQEEERKKRHEEEMRLKREAEQKRKKEEEERKQKERELEGERVCYFPDYYHHTNTVEWVDM